MFMERAGTGGSIFRNLYRDFLIESYEQTQIEAYKFGAEAFTEIALKWKTVSELFEQIAKTKEIKYVHEASELLKELSSLEKNAMQELLNVVQ